MGDVVLYRDRPEWSDVTPVSQPDAPDPVVAIQYREVFADCHAYLRAVMQAGEKSARVIELTKTCIDNNAANYTAWKYRRDAILHTGASIQDELDLIAMMCSMFPKNFQIWHHRGELLRAMGSIANEKEVTRKALSEDAKNYHVWSHRRSVIEHFSAYEGEKELALDHIKDDFRNNSAYNYLFYVMEQTELQASKTPEERLASRSAEIARALRLLERDFENEAAHNYLLGHLLPKDEATAIICKAGKDVEAVLLSNIQQHPDTAVWPRSSLAELYERALELGPDTASLPFDLSAINGSEDLRTAANALHAKLATIDPIRQKYWTSLVV
eukprot:TRINITY_DN37344_c0_g1_i1.p1 TRINITY_DN37344_c0_g1~~TRINITY_DN37344_c0_g1_i1.p1  ORF type:complete len:328 (+),score=86.41 TRINITY_DN37344_c0_g1_i1:168-1151(+)